jgi:polar amino acid transport system substrate-binding protein
VRAGVIGVAVAVLVAVAGCSGAGSAAGTFTPHRAGVLTVATAEVPSAGFWYGTAARPTGGFEYELAVALAGRLGLHRVRIVIVPFQRIVKGDLGGADLALALITPTTRRARYLDFSTPYIDAPPVILTGPQTSVPDLEAARQLRWGVVRDTTLERLVKSEIAPDAPPVAVSTNTELIRAIGSGRVDAGLVDAPLGFAYASVAANHVDVTAKLAVPESLAAALPNGSENSEAVDSAVRALIADGKVGALADRWLGASAAASAASVPLLRTTP